MHCNEALELLSAALDGELDPAQQTQLDEHLAQCPTCRALQAELLGLEEALGALDVSAPEGLKTQIMENLPPQQGKGHVIYWRRWGAMAACAALVLLGVWQLPRFVLGPKDVDSTEIAAYDAPAMDAAVQAPPSSETALTALNDEAPLPPYVEGDGINVNAMVAPQPDPDGASYTSYGFSAGSAPVDTPQDAPAFAADSAPMASHKLDNASVKASDTALASGALPQDSNTAPVIADGQSEEAPPPLLSRSYSPEENAADLPDPEAAPEIAVFTAVLEDGIQPVDLEAPAESIPEAAQAPVDAPVQAVDPFASYCGVLTLEEYQPGDQEFSVEFSEAGLRQYILSAGDFQALVAQMENQGLPYQLTAEGEGIDPQALCGLVVVTGQSPETPAEAS